jgi:hypothetical protein
MFDTNRTSITGTLNEDQFTFMIISLSMIHRMKNVSDKLCSENHNTYFKSNNIFF